MQTAKEGKTSWAINLAQSLVFSNIKKDQLLHRIATSHYTVLLYNEMNYLEDFESDASEGPFVLYKVSCCENIKAPIVDTSHNLKRNDFD